jgi:hypothetical protein
VPRQALLDEESLEELLELFPPQATNPVAKAKIKIVFFIFLLALSGIFFRSGMFGDSSIQVINKLFYGLFSFREGKLIYRYQELLLFISMGMFLNYIEYYNTILDKFKKMELVLLPIYSIFIMILLGLFGDGGGDFIYSQF